MSDQDRDSQFPVEVPEVNIKECKTPDPASMLGLQQRAAVAELMAGTVHDSRNIMTGVLSFAQIGQRRITDPSAKSLFDEIAGETLRCVDLLEQVLQLLRGNPLGCAEPEELELLPVVNSVKALVGGEARLKRIQIEVDVAPALPVWGDEQSVLQVLLNVVINAVQATPLDGRVRISAAKLDNRVEIRVQDSGSGVPMLQREQIFQSFFSTKGSTGTGLGLTMSRFLARQLGGDLLLEAGIERGGACFCLRLPGSAAARQNGSSGEEQAP